MPDPKSSYERLTQLPADATLTPAQRSDLDLQLANPLLASAKKKALRAHLPRESAMIDRRTGKLRNTTIVVCVLIIATGATLSSIFGPHRAEPTSAAAAAGGGARVIAHNVAPGIDLIAGEAHHVEEASTQERDAVDLISAREGHPESASTSPGQWIDAIYHRDSYRHFGGAGESPMPRCTVNDQDPVAVDDSSSGPLNAGGTALPVACATDDGQTLYVTAWAR